MDLLLLTQYFDMLRDVGQSSRAATVFLPHAPQSVAAIQAAMRDGFMQVLSHRLPIVPSFSPFLTSSAVDIVGDLVERDPILSRILLHAAQSEAFSRLTLSIWYRYHCQARCCGCLGDVPLAAPASHLPVSSTQPIHAFHHPRINDLASYFRPRCFLPHPFLLFFILLDASFMVLGVPCCST